MANGASASGDYYSEIQAWAAVGAILAGFLYLGFQRWLEARAAGAAAGRLARHSVDFVTERLEALIDPDKPIEFALRGARATEMIEVFREMEITKLPSRIIEPVAVIRSAVRAVNSRIDEVLIDDAKRRSERRSRLYSAGRTLAVARGEYDNLRFKFAPWNRRAAAPLSNKMTLFLQEAAKGSRSG